MAMGLYHILLEADLPSLIWIRKSLADIMPSKVASATGLHVNTITGIRDGKITDPKLSTVEALARYIRDREA